MVCPPSVQHGTKTMTVLDEWIGGGDVLLENNLVVEFIEADACSPMDLVESLANGCLLLIAQTWPKVHIVLGTPDHGNGHHGHG